MTCLFFRTIAIPEILTCCEIKNDVLSFRAVAIPEMLACCESINGIDKRIARFVIPFSVTISCNGSALYIAGATAFVGHLAGFPLTVGDYFLIW